MPGTLKTYDVTFRHARSGRKVLVTTCQPDWPTAVVAASRLAVVLCPRAVLVLESAVPEGDGRADGCADGRADDRVDEEYDDDGTRWDIYAR